MLSCALGTVVCLTTLASYVDSGQMSATSRRGTTSAETAAIEAYCQELDQHVKRHEKSGRLLADISSGKKPAWREFQSEEEREEADTGDNLNENAIAWIKDGEPAVVSFTFQSPSGDWSHFVTYYFHPDGTLAKVDATLNTFYGHMTRTRKEVYGAEGRLLRSSVAHFDLYTQKKRRPGLKGEEFVDEPVPVYRRTKDLPFYHLLNPNK